MVSASASVFITLLVAESSGENLAMHNWTIFPYCSVKCIRLGKAVSDSLHVPICLSETVPFLQVF